MFEQQLGRGLRCHVLYLFPRPPSQGCPVPRRLALTPALGVDTPPCHGSDTCRVGRAFPQLGTESRGHGDLPRWMQFGGLSPPVTAIRRLLIPSKQLGSSSEQGCNFGPFQLAFCSPALTGY